MASVTLSHRLEDGDRIRLGSVILTLCRERTGDSTETAVLPAARADDVR